MVGSLCCSDKKEQRSREIALKMVDSAMREKSNSKPIEKS